MENQEEKSNESIVNTLFKPDTVFTLSLRDVATLQAILQPLAWCNTIIENVKNEAAAKGAVVNTVKSDYELNKDGSFVLKDGQPILKSDFWDKYYPKPETKTLTVDKVVKEEVAKAN